jgi:hypothetical protein
VQLQPLGTLTVPFLQFLVVAVFPLQAQLKQRFELEFAVLPHIINMEELELSVADRVRTGRELLELADQGQQTKGARMRAREEEKLRVDRENWIINILKSGKVLTPDKKR